MGRFDEEGPVPVPFETKVRYSRTRQQELREAAVHVRESRGAAGKGRRWWPFGKRREKGVPAEAEVDRDRLPGLRPVEGGEVIHGSEEAPELEGD